MKLHRRGHGHRRRLRRRRSPSRQAAAYGGAADVRARCSSRSPTATSGRYLPGEAARRPRLRDPRHRGHRGRAAPQRHRVDGRAQALRGRAATARRRSSTSSPRGEVDMVVNTPSGKRRPRRRLRDPRRGGGRATCRHHDRAALAAAVQGIEALQAGPFAVCSPAGPRASELRDRCRGRPVSHCPFGARHRERRRDDAYGPLCVGIDPHPALLAATGAWPTTPPGCERFAPDLRATPSPGASRRVKPQSAFFERHGSARGRRAGATCSPRLRAARAPCRSSTPSAATSARRWPATPTRTCATGAPLRGRRRHGQPLPRLRLAAPGDRPAAADAGAGLFVLALTSNPEGPAVQHAAARSGRHRAVAAVIAAGRRRGQRGARGSAQVTRARLASGSWSGATVGTRRPGRSGFDLARRPAGRCSRPGVGAQGGTASPSLRSRVRRRPRPVLPSRPRRPRRRSCATPRHRRHRSCGRSAADRPSRGAVTALRTDRQVTTVPRARCTIAVQACA